MRYVGLALLVVAACSGEVQVTSDAHVDATSDAGVDPNDGAHSGTRLKLTWYAFADGTRQWSGFYDAERKEYCSIFSSWADGKSYCVPNSNGNIVYANAGCTAKVAQVYQQPGCATPPPAYILDYAPSACNSVPAHIYVRGAAQAVASYWYKNTDGSCGGPYTSSNETYYALGAELPTTSLVQVALGAPVGTARLGERFYTSPDGMRFPWSIHDAMLGADCYPTYSNYTDGASTAVCGPDNASYASYDHDAACSQPELDIPKACPTPPYAAVYSTSTTCPSDPPHYYTVGAALPSTPLYYPSGPSCVMTTGQPTESYFGLGQPLALATLSRTADTLAARRIQLIHYASPDGLSFRDYSLFDSQQGADCYPTTLPDGTIRCVVYGGYMTTYFSDKSCLNPIDLVELQTGPASCGPPTVPKFAQKYIAPQPGTCTYTTEVHPITAAYAGTVYTNYGVCAAYVPNQTRLYNVGAAVPLTDFVQASLVTDP